MKIRLAALALTLGALPAACDPEGSEPLDSTQYRGEDIDPPTRPIGTGLVVKGGHDNPFEMMQHPYERAPLEYQLAFQYEIEKHVIDAIERAFLSDERNLEECPAVCEELHLEWNDGVFITDLELRFGEVYTEIEREGPYEGQPCWVTFAEAAASVGCGCS